VQPGEERAEHVVARARAVLRVNEGVARLDVGGPVGLPPPAEVEQDHEHLRGELHELLGHARADDAAVRDADADGVEGEHGVEEGEEERAGVGRVGSARDGHPPHGGGRRVGDRCGARVGVSERRRSAAPPGARLTGRQEELLGAHGEQQPEHLDPVLVVRRVGSGRLLQRLVLPVALALVLHLGLAALLVVEHLLRLGGGGLRGLHALLLREQLLLPSSG
jgi:hypothetical protein